MKFEEGGPDRIEGLFGYYISVLSRSARTYFQKELKPYGIGPGQQAYLLALSPGEAISQDVLVKRLNVNKANVTRAVSALERLGLMTRTDAPADRRQRVISLTGTGIRVRKNVASISARWLEVLARGIPEADWARVEKTLGSIVLNGLKYTGE